MQQPLKITSRHDRACILQNHTWLFHLQIFEKDSQIAIKLTPARSSKFPLSPWKRERGRNLELWAWVIGAVFLKCIHGFFHVPSLVGLAFLIQSVRCRTKSKKKSPSGTEMTLSAILTNKENPSAERRLSRWPIEAQKSLARVEESTSKASSVSSGKYTWNI